MGDKCARGNRHEPIIIGFGLTRDWLKTSLRLDEFCWKVIGNVVNENLSDSLANDYHSKEF